MSLPWGDERADKLRAKFNILGVPVLVILDATTGFVVTATARKDLKKEVPEVYANWAKLLDLKKQMGINSGQFLGSHEAFDTVLGAPLLFFRTNYVSDVTVYKL